MGGWGAASTKERLRTQGHTHGKCCVQFWASPAVEKTQEVSERACTEGQVRQKNHWGQAAHRANYTLSRQQRDDGFRGFHLKHELKCVHSILRFLIRAVIYYR